MSGDIYYVFLWWLLFFILGIGSIPLTWLIFRKFSDVGYGFSKTISVLGISYLIFLASLGRLLPFTNTSLYLLFFAYLILNVFIFLKNKEGISGAVSKKLRFLVTQEILFTSGLILWSIIRGFHPDINGLEKFMDFGFINSILASDYLPPTDMWFAQNPINYYWFGHLSVAVTTKLSTLDSSVTYNLALATILGLTLTGAFSIASSLIGNLNKRLNIRTLFAAGLISAILLAFAGNLHGAIFVTKEGPDSYWYPDATRFIGYHPETEDKTIHEFPIYSFVVSDLHAHLINLPFVLMFIGLLFSYVLTLKKKSDWKIGRLIPLGFLLGVMFMTNAWDVANYLLLTGITLLVFNINFGGLKAFSFLRIARDLFVALVIAFIAVLPFLVNFESIAEGVRLVNNRTPVWQLGVLWGFPAILTTIFAVLIYKIRKNFERSDLFVMSLLITSWVLIIIPEIIFVKDIYIASHQRANTMFKLTYQAYVMFYLTSGYIAVRTITYLKSKRARIVAFLFFVILFTAVLIYPGFAINSFYGELKNYRGLAGDTWLKYQRPDEYEVVSWLKENISGQPVILEAPGDSYTEFNVVSAYTGLPTVSGWFVHEWLWRGDSSFPQNRVNDINEIYTSINLQTSKNLLKEYGVEYVIIGSFERQKYPNLKEEKFNNLGTEVFSSGEASIYKLSY